MIPSPNTTAILFLFLILGYYCINEARPRTRRVNKKRKRDEFRNEINAMEDEEFYRLYRMRRGDFNALVTLLDPLLKRNEQMAKNSSGSAITTELKLMITLRFLSGGSYLEGYHHQVSLNHVHEIVNETCGAIINTLNNIHLPSGEEELRKISDGWSQKMKKQYGSDLVPGIILSGDGYLVEIKQPNQRSSIFWNRKSCHALNCQAFCDSDCRFRVFDIKWPGSVNDLTAYTQTDLFHGMSEGKLPSWCHILMDNIYTSCSGRHLTPFSGSQLRRAQMNDPILYSKMRTYNKVICGKRITIERAFGILSRRFLLLQKRIDLDLKHVPQTILACVMLHNFIIDRRLMGDQSEGVQTEFDRLYSLPETEEPIIVESREEEDNPRIILQVREQVMNQIWAAGYRYEQNELST